MVTREYIHCFLTTIQLFSKQDVQYQEAFVAIFDYVQDLNVNIKKCLLLPFVTNGFWNVSIILSKYTHRKLGPGKSKPDVPNW